MSHLSFDALTLEQVNTIISECNQIKEKGNQHFKSKELESAEKYYQESLSNLTIFTKEFISKHQKPEEEEKPSSNNDGDVNNDEKIETETNDENNLINNAEVLLSEKETVELISKQLDLFKEEKGDNQVKSLFIVLYSNLALTLFQMELYQKSLEYCTIVLDHLDPDHYKSLYKRSQCYEELKNFQSSYLDMKRLQDMILKDPTAIPDQLAKKILLDAERLRVKSEEEQKKQLEEMWGQLKDVGSKFLGAFGINMNNFNFDKDPNTGSYSLSMNNNTKK